MAGASHDELAFLPVTLREMQMRGWQELDVLIITGDAYVDHPSFGAAVIGRVLEADGWRVGIVSQPDWRSAQSFSLMGRPRLFCGITSGNLDSMLAHYTASRRKRREDAYSEGGAEGRRPNHAAIVYAQRVREAFHGLPVILGGVEASLRRTVHYDYWEDRLKPSILLDSKADLLVYGMGEEAVREIAGRLSSGERSLRGIRGTAYLLGAKESQKCNREKYVLLPGWEECQNDRKKLLKLTKMVEAEQNPFCARPLMQYHQDRAVIIEPPVFPQGSSYLDRIYELPFTRRPHPSYRQEIPACDMVKDSITVLRGCAGGCSFCSLGLHQGKFLMSRSSRSVKREIEAMVTSPFFRGTVSDLGGPTANLYGCRNGLVEICKRCRRPGCLYPSICRNLKIDKESAAKLYREVSRMEHVKHVFISSGIRMDVALEMPSYMQEVIAHHTSGHLKVAPEHLHPEVLRRMRKPEAEVFYRFCELFGRESRKVRKEQYLVPYFISSFPGCTEQEMAVVEGFLRQRGWMLKQVQDFIPLPMTAAAAMYYTGLDYETEKPIYVARGLVSRRKQIAQLAGTSPACRPVTKRAAARSQGRKGR